MALIQFFRCTIALFAIWKHTECARQAFEGWGFVRSAPFPFWLRPFRCWVQLQRSCLRSPCNTFFVSVLQA
jgi:hypothetical protein